MPNIRKVELSEILGQLPEIRPLHPNSDPGLGPDDLFLCALGFEPRCLTIPGLLADCGYRSNRVVILEYDTNTDDNEKNRQELTTHLNAISDHVQSLPLSEPDAPNRLRRILESVANETPGGTPKITFDVSAAANRFVVTSMAILCESDGSLNVLYSEAAYITLPKLSTRLNHRSGRMNLNWASSVG